MNTYGFMLVKNEADIIAQTLESLRRFGGFTHIFVFDNGSTDETEAVTRQSGVPVRYVRQDNSGPGSATTRGFALAIEAGRAAYEAGVMAPQDMAVASTPVSGHPFLIN